MANMKKKNRRMIMVSPRRGRELNRAYTMRFRPSIRWIERRGLSTLKVLSPPRLISVP
jgi:hypothetical protein